MKLTIDRNKWQRGESDSKAFLFRSETGKMCCLGFYGIACGLTVEQLSDKPAPCDVACEQQGDAWEKLLNRKHEQLWNSSITNDLMIENDHEERKESIRERRIAELFASIGVEVEFIN